MRMRDPGSPAGRAKEFGVLESVLELNTPLTPYTTRQATRWRSGRAWKTGGSRRTQDIGAAK